jgi:predicted DNA-binding transcriptional regulator YafY
MEKKNSYSDRSKTEKCIKMLQILNRSGIVKIKDLAAQLNTNERNIPEYKETLTAAGYPIACVRGPAGGYYLPKKVMFPSLHLDKDEKQALFQGYNYLLARNDFMYKKEFSASMEKISSSIMQTESTPNTMIANHFPLAMPQEELEKRYFAISQCIATATVIDIEYLSLKNEITKRSLHPYKLYMYNNAWFVIGYDESKCDVRYFKLNRIQSFCVTPRSFISIPITFNERDYLDEFGMKNNGEWYPIKLKLSGNFAMLVKERIYGKNQTIESIDQGTTILSVEMQNKDDIVTFILGFRDKCEVLEPEWLRNEITETLKKINNIYTAK